MLEPRHTLDSVLDELIKGLEDGTIVLFEDEPGGSTAGEADPPAARAEANGGASRLVRNRTLRRTPPQPNRLDP